MKKIIALIGVFIILNLYFNLTTHFIPNTILTLLCILLFFPITAYLVKFAGIQGFDGLGLVRSKSSIKYFFVSFLIGFGSWSVMYLVYWQLGKFEITGIQTGTVALLNVAQVLVGFFLGSLINDIITRGYVIKSLQGKLQPFVIGGISVLVYALDDFWNGDLTLMNFVFSLILGCSFTYAFLKTGSLWANTGIHFGLNVAFGLFYGLSGDYGAGLITIVEGEIDPLINNLIVLSTASVLFLIVYFVYRKQKNPKSLDIRPVTVVR